jgi:hypothetical protein
MRKKQIVQRHDSKTSRQNSVMGRLSIFGGRNITTENLQMSPTSYGKLRDDAQDQESLIAKSKPIDERQSPADQIEVEKDNEPMNSINLN